MGRNSPAISLSPDTVPSATTTVSYQDSHKLQKPFNAIRSLLNLRTLKLHTKVNIKYGRREILQKISRPN